jgi:hypothetical protein
VSGVCVCDRKDWGKGMHAVFQARLSVGEGRRTGDARQAGEAAWIFLPTTLLFPVAGGDLPLAACGSHELTSLLLRNPTSTPRGASLAHALFLSSLFSLALCRPFFPFFYFLILSLTVHTGTRAHMTRAKKHSQMQQADHAAL